jgi:hypothetical protein
VEEEKNDERESLFRVGRKGLQFGTTSLLSEQRHLRTYMVGITLNSRTDDWIHLAKLKRLICYHFLTTSRVSTPLQIVTSGF